MRDHQYRGKRKDNGQRVEGSLLVQHPYDLHDGVHFGGLKTYIVAQDQSWNTADRCYHYERYEVDPATVGEFTGKRDSKGQDIYEGDTFNVAVNDTEEIVYRVVWLNKMACFALWPPDNANDRSPIYGREFADFVENNPSIGTCHDAPEDKP